jgi:maltooligosyltrehalose trehalohydrolase
VNFDGPESDEVRRLFIENAVYWIREFHIDALRLDAVHAIYDFSAHPFLQELATAVSIEGERLGRLAYTIAESSLNDSRILQPADSGGWGIDAQWCDDLHHAIHRTLTGEDNGYYQDFEGFPDLVRAYRNGFVYEGQYSRFRRRRHGNSARHVDPRRIVVCSQNHDQVGNRMLGERLTGLVDNPGLLRLAAALALLSPYQPLLFMGEEYGETAPFQYFVSHGDPDLVAAVRRGRESEFAQFQWKGEVPDPQSEEPFQASKLNHRLREEPRNRALREFYRELIRIRRTSPAYRFATRDQTETRVLQEDGVMSFRIWVDTDTLLTVFNILPQPVTIPNPVRGEKWKVILDSTDREESREVHLRKGDGAIGEYSEWELPRRSIFVIRKEQVS